DEKGRSNRARIVQIHGRQRFRMREAVRVEHRGARERSRGARSAHSRIDTAAPRGDLDAFYERGPGAGDVDETRPRPRFRLEHPKIRRRHQFVGALDYRAPLRRTRIENYRAHARSSLALSRADGIGDAPGRRESASLLPLTRRPATKSYFLGSTINEPPICAACNWQKYGNTPGLSATNVIVLGVPWVTTSAMWYAGIVKPC